MSAFKAKWSIMRRNKVGYLMMAPYLIIFLTFTVLPVIVSMSLSLTSYNGFSDAVFTGFSNFAKLFSRDPVFIKSLQNTIVLAIVTGPLSYLLCFGLAWVINEFSSKARSILTLLFYAPSISGQVFVIWTVIFSGDYYGVINGFLLNLGFINEPIQFLTDPRYMMTSVIIVQLWLSLGTSFLAFIAGFQGIDRTLYEAAAVDGVKNRFQEVWYVSIPCMKPILLFGALMQITASFSVGVVPRLLTGFPSTDYVTQTIESHLIDYGRIRFDLGYSSAIAVVLFVMMVGINRIVQRFIRSTSGE